MRIVSFLGTCVSKDIAEIANKKGRKFPYSKAKKLVKAYDPDIYNALTMDFYNPYAEQTKIIQGKYLVIVHSATEHLFDILND